MKVAVIGSRTFSNQNQMFSVLDKLKITHLVSGGARGADSLAEQWAHQKKIPVTVYKPDWERFGKSAGFLRNYDIIQDAELVVAFWDGTSKGTEHSIKYAKRINKPIIIEKF